jgi:hypothetical protein
VPVYSTVYRPDRPRAEFTATAIHCHGTSAASINNLDEPTRIQVLSAA